MENNNTHELKCWPKYFKEVRSMKKPFEVRKNDRDFKEGDELVLKEYDPEAEIYTGRVIVRAITYVLNGGDFGIKEGYCVLGLKSC